MRTEEEWNEYIAKGKAPKGTPMPKRLTKEDFSNGIILHDLPHRLFIVVDGNHRVFLMQGELKDTLKVTELINAGN